MLRNLDLGVVFTGDASSVVASVKAVRDILASLNSAMGKMGGTMKGMASGLSSLDKATASYSRTAKTVTTETTAFKNALEVGQRALAGDDRAIQHFRKSLIEFTKENRARALSTDTNVKALAQEATVINLARGAWDKMTKQSKGLSESTMATVKAFSKSSDAVIQQVVTQSAYQSAVGKSMDRSKAFHSALEVGYRAHQRDLASFNQYFKSLKQFDDINTARTISTNLSTKAMAVEATAVNLARGAYDQWEKVAKGVKDTNVKTTKALTETATAVEKSTAVQSAYQRALAQSTGRTTAFKSALETASRQFGKDEAGFNQYFKSLKKFDDINRARTLSTKAAASALAVEANAVNLSMGAWNEFEKTSGRITEAKIKAEKAQTISTKATKAAVQELTLYDRIVAANAHRGKVFADALEVGARAFGRNGWELEEYTKSMIKWDKQNARNRASLDYSTRSLSVERNAVNLARGAWDLYEANQERIVTATEKVSKSAAASVKPVSDMTAIQKEHSRIVSKLTDESLAFRNALETGTRVTKNVSEFKQYAKELVNVERINRTLLNSHNEKAKAMAFEETALNLSRATLERMEPIFKSTVVRKAAEVKATKEVAAEVQNVSAIQKEYAKVVSKLTDESVAFRNALETGTRITRNAAEFRQYTNELRAFDNINRGRIQSTDAATRALGVEANATNLSRGALQRMEDATQKASGTNRQVAATYDASKVKALGATNSIDAYSKKMSEASMQSVGYQKALQGLIDKHGLGSAKFKQAESALNSVEQAIVSTQQRMNDAGKAGDNFYNSANRVSLGSQKLAGTLKTTGGVLERIKVPLGDNISLWSTWKTTFAGALQTMAAWGPATMLVYGFVNALKAGAASVLEFDQALKDLKAITFATDAEILIMSETIKKLGVSYMFSISQISTGMKILGQAGFSASESIDTIKAVSILAAGTLSGMEETADLLTTTIRAFNMETTESGRVADIMATAVNKSKLDVDKLRIAFSYMAPAAKEAGISLEEAATATMLLADSGLRASTIGTSFRQFLAHLIAPTESAKGKLAALGANMDKLNPQFNSLKSILIELNRIIPDAGAAFDVFQLRAAPAVITMMKAVADGSDTYDEYLEKVYEVGVAQKMADIQMEGVINKVKNLGSRFTVLAASIGQSGVLGVFGAFVDVLRNIIDLFTYFSGGLGQYVLAMTLAGGAAFGLVKALGLLGNSGIAKLFIMWADTGYSATKMLGALKAGFIGLWAVLASNPLISIPVALAGVIVGLKMYSTHITQLGIEYAAQAVEIRKTEDKLKGYQNRLTTLNKDSLEYQSTLKRLASDYEPLRKYIDEVTGSWIDQTAGLKALDEEISKKHVDAVDKQVNSIAAQKFAIAYTVTSFNEFSDGVVDVKKETEQLTLFIKGLIPELKRLGITADSSGAQLNAALTKMYPSISANQIRYIADDLLRVLKEVEEKEAEQKKRAAEREVMYAQGTRTRVPEVFREMYRELGGLRAADAADLVRKFDEALEAERKHLDDRLINNEEFEKRRFKLALEYIDKIATASKSPIDTEGDVEKAKTDALKRYVEASDAQFKNQIADEKQAHKIRLEENKGFPEKIKAITDEHLKTITKLEAKAADQIATYWQYAWESRKKMTKENFDAIVQSILDFRVSLANVGSEVVVGPGGREGIGKTTTKIYPRSGVPTEPLTPTKGMVASDEDIMTKYKREVDEAIAISGQWGKAWAAEWEKATEFEKTELATQAVIFRRLAKDLGGTEAQIARGREMAADSAIKSYKKTIKERKREEQDLQKSQERFNNALATMGISASSGSEKILKQEELNLEKADQLLKEWIEEYTYNFNRIENETGQFKVFPDITEASERAKKLEEVIAQSTANTEKVKDEIRQGTWKKEVDYGKSLYDSRAEFDHKYLSFMKSNSEKLEAEYIDYTNDLKDIDRMVYDAKVWNALHTEAQIEGIEEKALAMRTARYEKHEREIEKIVQKQIDRQSKVIDKRIEGERDALEIEAGLKNLEALQAGVGQEILLGLHRDYVEKKYQIDKAATDSALAEIDRSTDYGKKQVAKYVNQEVQAYNDVIAANRAYYQELYKDSEYYYKNQLIADEEYFGQLEKLRKWGAISNREYTEKMVTLNGSMGEQVSLGFSRAKAGMQSFGELVVDWSTQMPETFSSGFTSAFREWAQGTKTAAQAWQDFAQSFLFWCGEMILKWSVMKAMGMMMGSMSGVAGSGYDKALGASVSGSSAYFTHHKGGIVGLEPSGVVHAMASIFNKAQKLHSGGIAGDERAIIAKKGEGVFTEGQMKALSPAGGNLNITNITDPRVIDAYMATPAGRKSILNIIGAEAFKVNRILRTA